MARIRSIKPGFASDSKVARLSLPARLTFLLLLPEADDEGRMVGSSKRLAGLLFPNDDDIGASRIEKWLRECEKEGLVVRYEADGAQYLAVTNFKKHQNPQHPTPSPLPPPPSNTCPDLLQQSVPTDEPHEDFENDSRRLRGALTKPSSLSVEGVERERERESSSSSVPNHQTSAAPAVEDDEEEISPLGKTLAIMADRRIAAAKAEGVVIQVMSRYRASVLHNLDLEYGDQIEKLLMEGDSPEDAIAKVWSGSDEASKLYPDATRPIEPVWDEVTDEHGNLVVMPRQVG